MRGKNEIRSFNYIKHELFLEEAFEINYESYCQNRIMLSKKPMINFFAMTTEDIEVVEDIFFTAKPNADLSMFPDFVFDGGFVEHFQITSSDISKAGAGYKKAFSEHEKEFEKDVNKLLDELDESPSFGKIKSVQKPFSYQGGHSHENLILSLKHNVEKHINSELNYDGAKNIKVFLIEYNELSLKMQIDYPEVKSEMMYGDMLRREDVSDYRLSRDKEALSFLYSKKAYIDYVVFENEFLFEIIKIEEIPEILKLLVFDYEFHPATLITMSSMYGTSFPQSFAKGEE